MNTGLKEMEYSSQWCRQATELIARIHGSQASQIEQAATAVAASIECGHATFLFGSGHSVIPVEEMYPRYGGLLGFIPMIELPLSFFTPIVGNMGFSQFDYLENNAEYGRKIMDSYVVHREDSLITFSHSGSTPVTLEAAMSFKDRGGKVIGVTSLSRSSGSVSKHPSGMALHNVADIIIDTCVPDGDVSVDVNGNMIGPLSSVGAVTVANLISIESVNQLIKGGIEPVVNPVRAFDPDASGKMASILTRYRRLYAEHIS